MFSTFLNQEKFKKALLKSSFDGYDNVSAIVCSSIPKVEFSLRPNQKYTCLDKSNVAFCRVIRSQIFRVLIEEKIRPLSCNKNEYYPNL